MWRGANWRSSTMLVHVTCLYPSQWVMLHVAHHFTPSQGVILISPLQHPTGLDSPTHTIRIYGYIRWLKSMTQLSDICGASPVNNHILSFCGHDRHFDEHVLRHMELRNIQPFVLKAGNSTNNQPNDNGPNGKLKSLYN